MESDPVVARLCSEITSWALEEGVSQLRVVRLLNRLAYTSEHSANLPLDTRVLLLAAIEELS